jgi:hypothetical protein
MEDRQMEQRRKQKWKKWLSGILLFMGLFLAPGITAHAKSEVITNPTASMYKNDRYTLELDSTLAAKSCYEIKSSDTSVIEIVDWNGRYDLKAKAKGSATITVTDSLTDQTVQSFRVKVSMPKLTRCFKATLTVIAPGQKVRITAKSGWTFTSRFPELVKVNRKGYVTGVAEGTGFIIAEDANGNVDCKEVIVIKSAAARKAIKKLEKKYRRAGYITVDEKVRASIEEGNSEYTSWSDYRKYLFLFGLKNGVGWDGIPFSKKSDFANVNSWKIKKIKQASDYYYIAYYNGFLLQGHHQNL